MASNISSFIKKPAGQAKKPPALPAGNYQYVIKGFETGDNNKNKTPYLRLAIGLLGYGEDIDQSEIDPGIDLSKRQMRKDFYLTDDSLWRLDEFIKTTGIDFEGKDYEEVFPLLVGEQGIAEVQQYMNQQNNEIGNQIGKLVGSKES